MLRSILLPIAALAIMGMCVLLWPKAPRTPVEPPRDQPPPAAEAVAQAAPDPAATPTALPPPQSGSPEALAAINTSKASLEAAAILRHKARYPRTSRRIEDRLDPIVRTRAVKERPSPPGQGRKPTLVVFSSSLSYEAPAPIIVFAKFINEYPNDWKPRSDAEIAGELINAADVVVAQIDLRDDGQGRDIEAGDGVFTSQLAPPEDALDQWNGLIRVKVYGETADGDRRSARTRFYYGTPTAKLTGKYKDELVSGHLQLSAEIDVSAAGDYRLDATLSGADGPLTWSQNTVHLEPGLGWLPVTFWGLAFREADEPGPYTLSAIALANVSTTPPQLNDATSTQYKTAAYKPTDFSTERANDPRLMERADRYEARARGGQ